MVSCTREAQGVGSIVYVLWDVVRGYCVVVVGVGEDNLRKCLRNVDGWHSLTARNHTEIHFAWRTLVWILCVAAGHRRVVKRRSHLVRTVVTTIVKIVVLFGHDAHHMLR